MTNPYGPQSSGLQDLEKHVMPVLAWFLLLVVEPILIMNLVFEVLDAGSFWGWLDAVGSAFFAVFMGAFAVHQIRKSRRNAAGSARDPEGVAPPDGPTL